MDFSFSEEQQMLLEATRRFIGKEYSFEARKNIQQEAAGFSRKIWQGFADLGLLAINIPEEQGGLGGGALETMLVMSVLGEGLVLEPYLASAVMASKAVVALANPQQGAALLPALASGEQIAVLAHDEPATRYDWRAVATRAWPLGEGYVLTGHKSVLPHGSSADILLVTARLAGTGQQGQPGPLVVFAIPRGTPGLRQLPYTTVDGVGACELWLDQVFVPAAARLDAAEDAEQAVGAVLDAGLAAICAEAVGALDKLLAASIQYSKDRKQFGTPIAKFQALQHRMADMVLHIEQARSMSYLAAVRSEDGDAVARGAALSAAKVVIGQACRFVGQQAVQLHGGMGVTDELDVSHYFKRLMAIELQFGSTDHHLEQYARQLA
ncbi:MAG: acyl-CoA dehydrogenase family protein [Pseudomonadota bacterium]